MLAKDRPRCFLDCETTGLDATKHEIIEISIKREDTTGIITQSLHLYIKPERIQDAAPAALAVNGYLKNIQRWEDAPAFATVAQEIADVLTGALIIGQNPQFDIRFLVESFKRAKHPIKLDYFCIDTITLIYEHLVPLGLKNMKLDTVRKLFGWPMVEAHSTEQDTLDTRRLFYRLSRATWLHRLYWRFLILKSRVLGERKEKP